MRSRSVITDLLTKRFNRTPIPESFSALRHGAEPVCIVTESDSAVVLSLLRSFALRSGYQDIRACREALATADVENSAFLHWVSIHDEAGLDALAKGSTAIRFSTFNIFSARGPVGSNPTRRVGFIKTLGILLLSRVLMIIFGTPLRVSPGSATRQMKLSRLLKLDFNRNQKLVRGTPFLPIEAQARLVLGGAEYEREISVLAQRGRESKGRLERRARREFFKMAANPRAFMYWLLAPAANFIVKRLFSRVSVGGLPAFAEAVKEKTVVVVPMHRSHLDYIILGSTLYQSGINPPVVAAGVNLSFWPAGFFIRSLGGYFVKRNARHDRVHALLLRRYVTYLVKRGHLQEFFIEGGRSRSGKMRPPKVGILSIIVSAYQKGLRKDIHFVPVSISYESVIEDKTFGDENTGRKKEKESFLALLKAGSIFKRKYGQVSLNFGAPISLQQFARDASIRAGGRDERGLVHEIAHVITRRIQDQTDISLSGLAYTALLMAPRYSLERSELVNAVRSLAEVAASLQHLSPSRGGLSPTLQEFLGGNTALIDDLLRGGVISSHRCLDEDIFFVRGSNRFTADFYKNATIHVFFYTSLFSVMELLDLPLTTEQAADFHPVFEYDFLLPDREEFMAMAELHLKALEQAGIIDGATKRFSRRDAGAFTPGLLLSSIQALLWTTRMILVLQGSSTRSDSPAEAVSYAELLSRLQSEFKTAVYRGLVSRTEASSQAALTSALESLQQRRLIAVSEGPRQSREISILKPLSPEIALLAKLNSAILGWQYREAVASVASS